MSDDAQIAAGIRNTIARAVERLDPSGARDEALATFVPPRRVLLIFPKDAALVPIGRVWRLGVFLLDREGTLYATGSTTRAVEPGYPGHQSLSAEHRRDYRSAAFRGPFARGETINFDAVTIDLDAENLRSSPGPLFLHDGSALVRWNASATGATAIDFDTYLAERVDLLAEPPEGA